MGRYLLHHRHAADECGVAFAAWKGHTSPLRGRDAFGTCRDGGHEIWWLVDADDAERALALLPHFVARRTDVRPIAAIPIP
jgi:hypothetical protein